MELLVIVLLLGGATIVSLTSRSGGQKQPRRHPPSEKLEPAQISKLAKPRRRVPSVVHSSGPRRIQGRVYVIDGDTIAIGRVKIRLAGIDAPEIDQPYGQKAKWTMVALCKGQTVIAELNGETSHDRFVGTCYLPDGRDLAAEMVKQGLALDWAMFSGGKYREFEPPGSRRRLTAVRHLNPSKNYASKTGHHSQRS